jgi:hypothetical protein
LIKSYQQNENRATASSRWDRIILARDPGDENGRQRLFLAHGQQKRFGLTFSRSSAFLCPAESAPAKRSLPMHFDESRREK